MTKQYLKFKIKTKGIFNFCSADPKITFLVAKLVVAYSRYLVTELQSKKKHKVVK